MIQPIIEGDDFRGGLKRKNEKTNSFFVKLSVLIALIPDLNRYLPKSIWIIVIALWYVHTFLFTTRHKRTRISLFAFVLIIGVSLEVLLRVVGYSTAEYGNYFIKIGFVDLLIKSVYLYKNYSKKEKKLIFRETHLLMLFLILQNIFDGITVPNIHYYIYFFPKRYIGMNVAMTEFYNVIAFFIGVLTVDFIYQKGLNIRLLDLISIVIAYYFLFSYEPRTTAITLSLLLVSLVLIKTARKTANRIVFGIAIVLFACFVISFAGEIVIPLLPKRVTARIIAVLKLSNARLVDSDYYGRLRLFLASWNTFLSSPKTFLVGIGYHLGDAFRGVIGQHAFIVDSLAAYGVLGGLFLIYSFGSMWKTFVIKGDKDLGNVCRESCLQVLFIAAFMSTIAHPEIAVAAILLPTCFCGTKE